MFKVRLLVSASFFISSVLLSSFASAGNLWCLGQLSGSYITSSGQLVINGSWRKDWTTVCDTRGVRGVDTVVCSLWASYAATAIKEGLNVRIMYSNPSFTCETVPTYNNAPAPAYVMLLPLAN